MEQSKQNRKQKDKRGNGETEKETSTDPIKVREVVRVCPGTGNGIRPGVPVRYQVQWLEATKFLRQFPRNLTSVPSIVTGTLYVDDCFLGVLNGTNVLANPGFESGAASWNVDVPSIWTIVQNP